MDNEKTVCPTCRLIQDPSEACGVCGETNTVPLLEAFERLSEVAAAGKQLGWSSVTQSLSVQRLKFVLLAAGVLAGEVLIVLWTQYPASTGLFWGALGAIVFGVFSAIACEVFVSEDPGDKQLAAVSYTPGRPTSATTVRGVAQKLEHSIRSHATSERCLAAHLTLGTRKGEIYFHSLKTSDFIITMDQADPMVVAGAIWIEAAGNQRSIKPGVAKSRLGVQGDYPHEPIAGEHLVRQGDGVEVVGVTTDEVIGQLADGYRDGGMTTVFRGRPGRPVVVKVIGPSSASPGDGGPPGPTEPTAPGQPPPGGRRR